MLSINHPLRRAARRLPHGLVAAGLSPSTLGYRWVSHMPLDPHTVAAAGGTYDLIEPARTATAPLPFNLNDPAALSPDPDWFGFSQRDVPTRHETETAHARLPEATIVSHTDEKRNVSIGLLDRRARALDMREVEIRPFHAPILRRPAHRHPGGATWVCERVYHNYSHWLTAHLPKILLLKERGEIETLVLPERRTEQMAFTLRALGIDIDDVPAVPMDRAITFDDVAVFATDKFRASLVGRIPSAFGTPRSPVGRRRIYITRAQARGRNLVNEAALRPALAAFGIEPVAMETLELGAQVELMQECELIAAPHGAGLTNMIFAPPGIAVIEIAAPDYPNPNFYALASALGHRFGLVPARTVGDGHLLYRDLEVDVDDVTAAVRQALA
jgi:hypothetical protein